MDAVEIIREQARMCKELSCLECELSKEGNCRTFRYERPKEAIAIIEQWAKKHPLKTYRSILLEKFPHTIIDSDGKVSACVACIFGEYERPNGCHNDEINCITCWDREAMHIWESNAQKCLDEIFETLLEDTTIVDSVGGNQGREILTERVINKYTNKKRGKK